MGLRPSTNTEGEFNWTEILFVDWLGQREGEEGLNYSFISPSVMSGVHGHGRGLTHPLSRSGRRLLWAPRIHQVVERGSTLNECVQGFLDAWVVKVDAWSRVGWSLASRCSWHPTWRHPIALECTWGRANWRHGGPGTHHWWGLRRGWVRWVTMGLGSHGGTSCGGCCCTTVEEAENLRLQLLLLTGVGRRVRGRWQGHLAGLGGCVSRVGWRGQAWGLGQDLMVGCCNCGLMTQRLLKELLCMQEYLIQKLKFP